MSVRSLLPTKGKDLQGSTVCQNMESCVRVVFSRDALFEPKKAANLIRIPRVEI